ncbi:Carbamoyl-phosphate synthase large chain [Brevundimonas diminuta]|uniref:carbamoyl-phosphate synthase large subunit n=1 Tax=Brevundimonas diminuta TaxID=293 RepID=UPI000207F4B7|nr:carbamoyl-phosphate synthase large subunit [Brevundimonas diminuta]EGF95585.1 carbamoyl-phosphate synthase, large subunit [Brevundimonas diminuta ATCC 11568]OWR19369.1 carbamoyl phosphate synthase large subunit [Brevundimonas diminuta]WQE45614.1 carbamoyl-phosphate synthase large subunit [Brevundimonas diminuta]SPU44468.1 Carbamoyl-phosphate synthase large chain [Brevundimonas diminuta]SUW14828.1 Carbamoyl-phosphate synthase large chain [Brevundimonas diminuta]
MPKRTDIQSILIIGAGPIVIGQACEFDYSGVQACKALKAEGYRVILVNSNPATIMTDPEVADATYIEPITPEMVEKIIAKEKPDALLPTMGGQTALNTALALNASGALARHGVEMIGAKAEVIDKAEDRQKFRDAMDKLGLESPRSRAIHHIEEADDALAFVGLPAIIRPSFTLAGTGGGIAYNVEEFHEIVERGLDLSPTTEVLIEESVLGWKEYEMEVVRDHADNCIIICSIENIDPMGVHTGDSITVAPAMTLTDKEYQMMRAASIAVLREIGVETGGSNVQFAVNPKDGRLVVIEMNPRVSRSSALASKATGFPIAKIAAKLAVGYTLDELKNDITMVTPASFEPAIDYVVTKIPRFAFEKYPGSEPSLTTAMKSVGEVMAIGRTFQESMQKALRGLETGLNGFDDIEIDGVAGAEDDAAIKAAVTRALGLPTPDRIRVIAQAFRHGLTVEEVQAACSYEPWFLRQIADLIRTEGHVRVQGLPTDATDFRKLKAKGFSDARLGALTGKTEGEVRKARRALDVRPVFKRIDTCAAEFASATAYMYSTYETGALGQIPACEAEVSDRKKAVILGGGPNRIGQGIEFDYCCCHAAFAFDDIGVESIMVNCNPETVSTDYDTSDRLYFEPLTAEDVLELIDVERSKGELIGVVVQFGGQTPLKLAHALQEDGVPILGTSVDSIDLAEDRERFQQMLQAIGLQQPPNALARSAEEAAIKAEEVGYPVVLRPSYVLGGRGMMIVHDREGLDRYVGEAMRVSGDDPVLIDHYLNRATEVDVDALCDDETVFVAGVLEHIEEAGVHSGDSACSMPPFSLRPETVAELKRQTTAMAKALKVRGLMNVQFAIEEPHSENPRIFVLEVNPRASRTAPFVAKTIGQPVAAIAAKVMAGVPLSSFGLVDKELDHIAVKEAVFPFARFAGVDTILGPEMRSTGEVMGLDWKREGEADLAPAFARAFAKSQTGGGTILPTEGTAFVSVRDADKPFIVEAVKTLLAQGFSVIATGGTHSYLTEQGLEVGLVKKVLEGRPNIVDAMKNGEVQLVFNTTDGKQALADSFSIRRTALMMKIPYYTTASGSLAAAQAIAAVRHGEMDVRPIQSYN